MNEIVKCEDLEILLADYLDGSLASEERAVENAAVELHLSQCVACGELARDASSAMAFLADAPEVEAPPVVIRQILRATTERPKPGFLAQVFGNGFAVTLPRFSFANLLQPLMQPRVAMGLAMAALSLVMVGRFWGTAEHAAYRAWDRTVNRTLSRTLNRTLNGYENLAVVYDVQNRLDEWRAQSVGGSQNNPAGSDGRK